MSRRKTRGFADRSDSDAARVAGCQEGGIRGHLLRGDARRAVHSDDSIPGRDYTRTGNGRSVVRLVRQQGQSETLKETLQRPGAQQPSRTGKSGQKISHTLTETAQREPEIEGTEVNPRLGWSAGNKRRSYVQEYHGPDRRLGVRP